MRKREKVKRTAKAKKKVDYRHRWPTQQTLVESRVSVNAPRFKRHWKSGARWLRRLKTRSSPEPGKSTHPYDTGFDEQESNSGSTSGSMSDARGDRLGFWKMFSLMPPTPLAPPPSPAPALKFSHTKDDTRPETPKTPVQHLRLLASPRKSPFPRSRTATPSDFDKATLKSTRSRIQTPAPPPPPVSPPALESPKTLSDRFKSFVKRIFSLGWVCS